MASEGKKSKYGTAYTRTSAVVCELLCYRRRKKEYLFFICVYIRCQIIYNSSTVDIYVRRTFVKISSQSVQFFCPLTLSKTAELFFIRSANVLRQHKRVYYSDPAFGLPVRRCTRCHDIRRFFRARQHKSRSHVNNRQSC